MPKGYVYFAACDKSTAGTILLPNSYLAEGRIAPVVILSHEAKQKCMILHWRIGLVIFKNFADQDWIGFNFIGSGLDSDWKISQSAHLWWQVCSSFSSAVFFFIRSGVFLFYLFFYWKSVFFYSGQILEMYVVLLYFPFTNTVISQA